MVVRAAEIKRAHCFGRIFLKTVGNNDLQGIQVAAGTVMASCLASDLFGPSLVQEDCKLPTCPGG